MGRLGTTIALTLLTFTGNVIYLSWWALITTPLLLSFPLYLIWVDSKKPGEEQWRYYNRLVKNKPGGSNE